MGEKANRENADKYSSVSDYMEEKYGEGFTVFDSIEGDIDINHEEFYCNSDSMPGKTITVFRNSDGSFSDNYYGMIVKDEFSDIVTLIIDSEQKECKVFCRFTADFFDNRYTKQVALKDALAEQPYQFHAIICVFSSDNKIDDERIQNILEKLRKSYIFSTLRCYSIGKEDYAILTADNFKSYVENSAALSPYFETTIK